MLTLRRAPPRRGQRGLSLVEMMVGVAVGLVVVAGAALMISSQLGENRRLLVETQLQQDMRAAMDLMTRELRRIGTRREVNALASLAPANGGSSMDNMMARLTPTASGIPVSLLDFTYETGPAGNYFFGFRRTASGVVQSKIGPLWQDLTDGNVMNVLALSMTPVHGRPQRLTCAKACADGSTDCWPEVVVRDIEIVMQARARSDASVVRTLRSTVRLRNDWLNYKIAVNEACPP